jgi:hypothetical protein
VVTDKPEKTKRPRGGRRTNRRKPRPLSPERRLAYGIAELAEMLGWSRQSIWRRIKKGQIRTTALGPREVITLGELRRLGILQQEAE